MKKIIAFIIPVIITLSIILKLSEMGLFIEGNNSMSSNISFKSLSILLSCGIFIFFIITSLIKDKVLYLISDYKILIQLPLVVTFFIIISFSALTKSKFDVTLENRNPNLKPTLFLENGDINRQLFKHYEAWFNDYFGGRNWLIDKYGYINYEFFNLPNSKKAMIGKNDWLFYSNVGDGDPVSKYQNDVLFTEEQLIKIKEIQEIYFNKLRENNIDYVLFITPSKSTIYPEYYPDTILKVNEISKTDQVVQYLQKNTDIPVVDVRKTLLQNKNKAELYFKADTHWNNYGAFLGYQKIVEGLSHKYKTIKPMQLSDFSLSEVKTKTGDLLGLANISPEYYKGESIDYEFKPKQDYKYIHNNLENSRITTEIQDTALPKAVVYRDSFFRSMQPFFSNHFRFVDYRWANLKQVNLDEILEQKPDIVVYEFVERYIDNLLTP